jgi:uncharacterized protein (DUF58 family)
MKSTSKKQAIKPSRQVERHLNLRLLPILILAFAIVFVLTNFRGWLVFFIGTAGAWLISILWMRSMERNLHIERKIHLAWATVGESVPEQFKLINTGLLPALWVEITDASSSLESPLRMVSDVGPHSYRSRHLNHLFKRRGLYTLGPTRLRCSDPFGIYTLTLHDQHASTILVTPPILLLNQLRIPAGGWSGDERHRRGAVERNISDAGVRNYVAGDSLRRIHWRASAHFDTLIVRQLEAATSLDWLIFVDLDGSVQAGGGQHSTLELSIVVAASLAMRGLKERRRIGLVLAGPKLIWLEPSTEPAQRWRILRALSMADAGNRALSDLITQIKPAQTATSILITPSSNPAWVAMADRKRGAGGMMALLVDPTNFDNPVDLSKVTSALAHSRIPYTHMPGSLLEEAYSTLNQSRRRQIMIGETRKRYLLHGRQDWQSMD